MSSFRQTAARMWHTARSNRLPTAFFMCAMLTSALAGKDDFKRSWDRMNQQAERSQQQQQPRRGGPSRD